MDEQMDMGGIADDVLETPAEQPEQGNEPQADEDLGGIADEPQAEKQDGEQKQQEEPKPEPYELAAPEGFDVPEDNLKGFSDVCNKAGITKEQAEQILAWHHEQHKLNVDFSSQQEAKVLEGWKQDILSDKEFGGKNYKATVADARRAFQVIDPDGSLREFLRESKGQYHPEVIRAVARVGRMMGEHGFVGQNGEGNSAAKAPLWKRMYGEN